MPEPMRMNSPIEQLESQIESIDSQIRAFDADIQRVTEKISALRKRRDEFAAAVAKLKS